MEVEIPGQGVVRAGEEQLDQPRISNAASSFNEFWNTTIQSKWS